jgi:hypothetical protein
MSGKYCENLNVCSSCGNPLSTARLAYPPYSVGNEISKASGSVVQPAEDKASLGDSKHHSAHIYETDSACIQYGTSINFRVPSVYLSMVNSANIGEDAEA